MNLLLDACVWRGAVAGLEAAGHNVDWAGNWDRDPGDAEILARAYSQRSILVTLDKDFGELAIVRDQPHSGILRLVNWSSGNRLWSACRCLTGTAMNCCLALS